MSFEKVAEWLEIGRTGNARGKIPLTKAIFSSIIKNFASQKITDGVPLTKGHPKVADPRYGDVEALEMRPNGQTGDNEGYSLWMKWSATKDFIKEVKDRIFPNRSIGLELNGDGEYQLRHVGFLGAWPPAMRNMQPARFCAEMDDFIVFGEDLDDYDTQTFDLKGEEMKLLKQFFMAPADEIGGGASGGGDNTDDANNNNQGDDKKVLEVGSNDKAFAELSKQLEEQKAQLAAERHRRIETEQQAFCDKLIANGKLTPAMGKNLASFMASLNDEADSFCFADTDGKEQKTSQLAFMQGFLTAMPDQAPKTGRQLKPQQTTFNDQSIDLNDRSALNKAAESYAAEKGISYQQALNTLIAQAR